MTPAERAAEIAAGLAPCPGLTNHGTITLCGRNCRNQPACLRPNITAALLAFGAEMADARADEIAVDVMNYPNWADNWAQMDNMVTAQTVYTEIADRIRTVATRSTKTGEKP